MGQSRPSRSLTSWLLFYGLHHLAHILRCRLGDQQFAWRRCVSCHERRTEPWVHTKPAEGSTHWSVRTVAAETGISKTSVQRYFQLFGLQPHRTENFKLSNDPLFIEKLRDVVGLYLSPPDNALVICVDEKSQCQALERTQPMLPMGFGYVEGVTRR